MVFYGGNINYQKNSQISERLEKYKNRIPDNFLPISSNEFGDLICLCTQGERIGQIFYWDHENEWDEEDYFDEFGVMTMNLNLLRSKELMAQIGLEIVSYII